MLQYALETNQPLVEHLSRLGTCAYARLLILSPLLITSYRFYIGLRLFEPRNAVV